MVAPSNACDADEDIGASSRRTKKVKADEELVEAAGKEKLSIKPKDKAKKKAEQEARKRE